MGKKSKKGQHHDPEHIHHKAGQGTHGHHKYHGGPLHNKYHPHHHHGHDDANKDDEKAADETVASTEPAISTTNSIVEEGGDQTLNATATATAAAAVASAATAGFDEANEEKPADEEGEQPEEEAAPVVVDAEAEKEVILSETEKATPKSEAEEIAAQETFEEKPKEVEEAEPVEEKDAQEQAPAEEAPVVVVNERSLLLASPEENEAAATDKNSMVAAIGLWGTLITWLDLQWIVELAVVFELFTCILQFGFGWSSARIGPIHLHHAYLGIAILLYLVYRPIPNDDNLSRWKWAFRTAWALILADFAHHFLLLWPATGDPL